MSRREPAAEARLIGQALFAPNGERGFDAFIRLRDHYDKAKVFEHLEKAFTSSLPIEQKISAYKHLCSMDTHKVFLNYLHSRLPEILMSIPDPINKEQFLLAAWAESRDVIFKKQLQALKQPTQLATLEIQFPDLTEADQQRKLMTLIETGNSTAILYWQIKQPTLLRAAQARAVGESKDGSSDNDSDDGSYIDNDLMLLDMMEQPVIFVSTKVISNEDDDVVRRVVSLHTERIEDLQRYIEFKLAQHPQSPFYYRLASELLLNIKGVCMTPELDTDILKYKTYASTYGDIDYSRELYTANEPSDLLHRAERQDKAAIYMLHALAGVPVAECDESAVSDILMSIKDRPDIKHAYRQALAECYLMGHTVARDVIYANQLLDLDTSLSRSSVAEAKAGGDPAIEERAQLALYDCPYSMRYGEVVRPGVADMDSFKQKQLSTHMLNIGCPLEAVIAYGESFVPGLSVAGELLSGSYERYTGQSIAEHFSDYIRTATPESESFSAAELMGLETSVYRNLNSANSATSDDIYERLRRGEVVDIFSGWSTHSLQCSFKMINGECYLMYANSGGGSHVTGSGITLYHIGNREMLGSANFVARLRADISDPRYVLSHDKRRHGLGKDLQLTPVGFVPKNRQKTGNCAVKAAKNQVLMHLMYSKLESFCKAEDCPPSQALLERSHHMAYEWYKPFVAYSRRQSVHATLKFCDEGYPAHIEPAQYPSVIKQILNYINTKDSGNQADLMKLLLPVQKFLLATDIAGKTELLVKLNDTKLKLLQNTIAKDAQHICAVLDAFTPEELAPHAGLLDAIMIEAVRHGDIAAIERCQERGCSLNTVDPTDQSTLLIEAASHGQADCAKWLLDHDANPFTVDSAGKTALDYARDNGHERCCRVMEAYPDDPAPSAHIQMSFLSAPQPRGDGAGETHTEVPAPPTMH
ncbi:MAG: ankyrin repeat domain-containing protein [Coxiellaceae bacterium]|nr:ankyrin repeat domain-containing protein [Coxiellaceae bacterium]